jgi:hypothetical protein
MKRFNEIMRHKMKNIDIKTRKGTLSMNRRQMDSKENFDIQPKKKTKHKVPKVKMERSAYSRGRKRQHLA